ncbi:phosphate transport system substrate-binding protein [Streptomyces sp. SAI-135]|nr:phosphate transport system substrate-binding protein [Streptomyces sp. SAI-090]MDH6618330.1 phosphate transport system substrate-binding protein [Streptomyces sp. SAI-135]
MAGAPTVEWLSAENFVAVGTAVLGIVASGVMVWFERRVPRRKRIGYRVQMDNPIGDDVRRGRANVRLGLFDEAPDMSDATLVLLRIENDGSQGIDRDDYTGPERHGLTAVFSDRTVRGVSVTQPIDTDHLMDHFTPERGFGYEDNRLRIPRVPLNRGEHYKLLVLLSGGDVGRPIRMIGGIRDGEVHPNRSATPDEIPPVLSPAARIFTGLLTLSVLVLATIVVARDDTPPPLGCETGSLTVTGSTAFAPVIETLAKEYEKDCEGAEITVEARGSEAGVAGLAATGARSAKEARSVIAFSDGPMGDRLGLHGERIALSVFTLVVNDGIDLGARGLTRAEVERLYRGEVGRWSDLNASRPAGLPRLPGLPVVLVSRDAYSGTRQIFQERVLAGAWEMTPTTSLDCDPLRDKAVAAAARPAVTRCELASTHDVLDKVAAQPGALGYSELTLATGHEGVRRVPLDGEAASVDHLDSYPYRGVEYAYTYRPPAPGSLAAGFLACLDEGTSQDVIRRQGHLPCGRAAGLCG